MRDSNNVSVFCLLAIFVARSFAMQLGVGSDNSEADELRSSVGQRDGRFFNFILKSTSTITSKTTTTISTVSWCAKANYQCGGGRKKRYVREMSEQPVINEEQYNAEMQEAVAIIDDPVIQDIVKRDARKMNNFNLARYGTFKWIPSPVQEEEEDAVEVEAPVVEKRSVPSDDDAGDRARFFNLITVVATTTSTSTITTTTTFGTVAITGTSSQCPSGSITDYLSACG